MTKRKDPPPEVVLTMSPRLVQIACADWAVKQLALKEDKLILIKGLPKELVVSVEIRPKPAT